MHAYTPAGTPVGTARAAPFDRTERTHGAPAAKLPSRKQPPIEGKVSLRWLTGSRPPAGRHLKEDARDGYWPGWVVPPLRGFMRVRRMWRPRTSWPPVAA